MKSILNLIDALPSVFTTSDIMDESFMEDMMGDHYEKYKIFARSLMKVDSSIMDKIDEIECLIEDTRIEFNVVLSKSKHVKFMKYFKSGLITPCTSSEKEFDMGASSSGKTVNIYIENVGFLKEAELYEGRLDID